MKGRTLMATLMEEAPSEVAMGLFESRGYQPQELSTWQLYVIES